MDEQDKQLFREAMGDVRPLKHKHSKVVLKKPSRHQKLIGSAKHRNTLTHCHRTPAENPLFGELEHFPPWQLTEPTRRLQADEPVFHAKDGVQPRMLKHLKRGTYPMEMTLDLHGHSRKQADAALHNILTQAQQHGIRGLRLVPGKGQRSGSYALLKSHLCHWLEQDERILAFCTATPSDGGGGALYLLLRKS